MDEFVTKLEALPLTAHEMLTRRWVHRAVLRLDRLLRDSMLPPIGRGVLDALSTSEVDWGAVDRCLMDDVSVVINAPGGARSKFVLLAGTLGAVLVDVGYERPPLLFIYDWALDTASAVGEAQKEQDDMRSDVARVS